MRLEREYFVHMVRYNSQLKCVGEKTIRSFHLSLVLVTRIQTWFLPFVLFGVMKGRTE